MHSPSPLASTLLLPRRSNACRDPQAGALFYPEPRRCAGPRSFCAAETAAAEAELQSITGTGTALRQPACSSVSWMSTLICGYDWNCQRGPTSCLVITGNVAVPAHSVVLRHFPLHFGRDSRRTAAIELPIEVLHDFRPNRLPESTTLSAVVTFCPFFNTSGSGKSRIRIGLRFIVVRRIGEPRHCCGRRLLGRSEVIFSKSTSR